MLKVDHNSGTTLFFWLLMGAQKLIFIISITTSSTKEIRWQTVFVGCCLLENLTQNVNGFKLNV